MTDYEPIDLSELCNAGLGRLAGRAPPVGDQEFHGLPFRIGAPEDPQRPRFIILEPGASVTVPLDRIVGHVIVANRRLPGGQDGDVSAGTAVAEYTFRLAVHRCPVPTAATLPG